MAPTMAPTCTSCEKPVAGNHNAATCGRSRGSAPLSRNPIGGSAQPADPAPQPELRVNSIADSLEKFDKISAEQAFASDRKSFGGHSYHNAQNVAAINNDNVCRFKNGEIYEGGMEDYQGSATADLIAAEENTDLNAVGPVFYGIRPRTGALLKIVPYGFVDTKDGFDRPINKYKVRVIPAVDTGRGDGQVDYPLEDEHGNSTSWTGRVPSDFGLQVDWANQVNGDQPTRW
jgi:hypothetical protein